MNREELNRLIDFYKLNPLLAWTTTILFIIICFIVFAVVANIMERNEKVEKTKTEYIKDLAKRVKQLEARGGKKNE